MICNKIRGATMFLIVFSCNLFKKGVYKKAVLYWIKDKFSMKGIIIKGYFGMVLKLC